MRPTPKASPWLPLSALFSAALGAVLLTALAASAWPAPPEAKPRPSYADEAPAPQGAATSPYPTPQVDASAPPAEPSPTF